ncbi:MAG: hypothetical protein A3K19_31285 [Lentisphaerae bacterium RIFOXYB12_FULL_65_16]|nr:MAG: hypothetical protein A3K18_22645 [Lentisphaerae bacterium RIFOXYA12_64_32]OGV87168.1 MAG: hypothetical protein A3K19_31285 [Lentisphaerae bacterium RIFOXYB12_FULL_65_16]
MRLPRTICSCLVLLLVSCRGLQDIAPAVQSGMAGDPQRLAEGRRVYLESCTGCHSLQAVDELSAEKWDAVLPGMAKKAKLDPESAAKLSDYIMAARQWKAQTNTTAGP